MSGQIITARAVARTLGLAVLAGAVSGLVIGGIGGRLFMFVLARLNPEEHGLSTDDGFEMGQFTVSGTLNLIAVTTVIGIVGGVLFLVLRGLRFGPGWFRVLSMPIGTTIVVGALLVHSDGVDFSLLQPRGLAVAFTLAVPFLYTLMVAPSRGPGRGCRPHSPGSPVPRWWHSPSSRSSTYCPRSTRSCTRSSSTDAPAAP